MIYVDDAIRHFEPMTAASMTLRSGCLAVLLWLAAMTPARAKEPSLPPTPLDLKLGDALRYFPAAELDTPLDERLEEIIVKGQRMQPLRDRRDVPPGLFPSLKYAATHPLDFWRIVAPVSRFQIPDRNIDDPKDPPGAYRGKILEPGAIYD